MCGLQKQSQTSVGSRIMIKLSDTWQTEVVHRLEYPHQGCGWPGIIDTLLKTESFYAAQYDDER